ncbi:MAG: ATP-binding cassette domain-containing protein [Gemmatimonadaceae bacterium]
MPLALNVQNLWKSYTAGVQGCSARVWALRGCSLSLEVGERVAIVGARGAGKRTLLQCIAGDRIDAGRIEVTLPLRCHFACADAVVMLVSPALHLMEYGGELRGLAGSVVVTSRDAASVLGSVDRILLLRDGRLAPMTHVGVRRVAERIAGA